ncbi:MAG: hypothetical protein IT341_07215 [Chloroflexi bacterium]|nr:hypothetical protein [Chloroflexota bacterium]
MTTLLLDISISPIPDEERSEVDPRDQAAADLREPLPAWVCGLDSDDPIERERCRDIAPDLIVELI